MISVNITHDLDYVAGLLKTPGIGKLCGNEGGRMDDDEIDALVADPNYHFVLVSDDDERVGFVSFVKSPDSETAIIHVAVRTRGAKTVEAITLAMRLAHKELGINEIHAIYPETRRSVTELAKVLGFENLGKFIHPGYDSPVVHCTLTPDAA